jgi:Domain of unknown function (DUF4365)
MKPTYHTVYVQRRSELMAELFLQQLGPVARVPAAQDLGYDLLVTVKNRKGGSNTFGVQVKGTESEVRPSRVVDEELSRSLTLSNIPGFLLVADVKRNKLFYGWPDRASRRIALHEIDDQRVSELRNRLADWRPFEIGS